MYRAIQVRKWDSVNKLKVFIGFIKGRFIGQNVRFFNDIMDYTEAKNLPGILLFVDFSRGRPSTPLNGIFSTSVLNYATLVQVLESGYPFFITMSKVA